eukprot:762980-Hanusia_phi.AAC.4
MVDQLATDNTPSDFLLAQSRYQIVTSPRLLHDGYTSASTPGTSAEFARLPGSVEDDRELAAWQGWTQACGHCQVDTEEDGTLGGSRSRLGYGGAGAEHAFMCVIFGIVLTASFWRQCPNA